MRVAIEGMHCQACVRRVQNAIVKVEGASVLDVEIGYADVAVDPKQEEVVLEAVHKAGYKARRVD
jgi:copper chaperone